MKKLAILALAVVTALAGFTPARALPLGGPAVASGSEPPLIRGVQYRGGDEQWYGRWDDRADRWERYEYRRDRRGWYNGHRGYSHARPGYHRHYDGYWYPLAALGAAAVIGGVIVSQPRPIQVQPDINPRHVAECSARYRSYRSYDNTYQPKYGQRQQCYSAWY